MPQPPQLAGSVCSFTYAPAQSDSPVGHAPLSGAAVPELLPDVPPELLPLTPPELPPLPPPEVPESPPIRFLEGCSAAAEPKAAVQPESRNAAAAGHSRFMPASSYDLEDRSPGWSTRP